MFKYYWLQMHRWLVWYVEYNISHERLCILTYNLWKYTQIWKMALPLRAHLAMTLQLMVCKEFLKCFNTAGHRSLMKFWSLVVSIKIYFYITKLDCAMSAIENKPDCTMSRIKHCDAIKLFSILVSQTYIKISLDICTS